MTGEMDKIVVDATELVGSARLAAALEAQDASAIGAALRHDFVVVPVTRNAAGEVETRVFAAASSTDDAPRYDLCLFSSTETFQRFLGDVSDREFALQRGSSLEGFLAQYVDFLDAVMFDPAGPHPITATAADALAALQPRPEDDDVAWVVEGDLVDPIGLPDFPEDADPRASRVTGFDLPLSGDWFPISVDDPAQRDEQVAALVSQQLATLGPAPVLRAELTRWLTETCARAAAGGAQFLAYLLQRNKKGALALNLVLYWQELGPQLGGVSHLDAQGSRLRERLAPEGKLLTADTPAGPLIRYSRIAKGAEELGGSQVPLLLVDYWLEFPDRRGLCLIAFSSPQAELGDALLTLLDNIVLSGAWVLETAAE
ncbi:hypothetical protein [Parafrigoribacterium soli]|uniref:hypothetical protein n=1 Tax=Parafrigoribacterium soli TaxID=3144663 RepID=UPI0032EE5507